MIFRVHGIGKYGPHSPIGPARWPFYDLIVLTEGSLQLQCGKRRASLLANDAVLIPPGTPFRGATGADGGITWVQHFSAAPSELPASIRQAGGDLVLRSAAGSELASALLRRLHALREASEQEGRRLRLSLFQALLLELAQAARAHGPDAGELARLRPAVSWAEQHVGQAKNLRAVARQAGISESHFRSLFRRWRGRSAGAWLRERRMIEARQLLSSTDLSLKEISAQLGFSDVVGFNRSFRQFHGLPPGRFRRANPRPV
jgi:AraC-like DNA-binding protein